MNQRNTVAVIIVNWNNWKDTIECLQSIYNIDYEDYYVILVDNASSDGSIKVIKQYVQGIFGNDSELTKSVNRGKRIEIIEYTEDQVISGKSDSKAFNEGDLKKVLIIIENSKNYGYAKACNIGVNYAMKVLKPCYILLINNDVVVDRFFLKRLVEVSNADLKIGCAGPMICYYDQPYRLQQVYGKRNLYLGIYWRSLYNVKEPCEVDSLIGAALLIKAEVIERVGLFDPLFFMYTEETDLCLRIRKAGYKLVYVPSAKVYHKASRSSGGELSLFRLYYCTRNQLLLARKHLIPLLFFPLWIPRFLFTLLKNLIKTRNLMVAKVILKGLLDFTKGRFGKQIG